ncbi:MAG: hypothetical protein AAGU75_03720 [Bacillota bacterium]
MECIPVKVTIEFYGHFIDKAKTPAVTTEVSSALPKGLEEIKAFLFVTYNIESGYMIRINHESMAQRLRKNVNTSITENDIIKIIPVISGG